MHLTTYNQGVTNKKGTAKAVPIVRRNIRSSFFFRRFPEKENPHQEKYEQSNNAQNKHEHKANNCRNRCKNITYPIPSHKKHQSRTNTENKNPFKHDILQ